MENIELILSEIKSVLGKSDYRKLIHFFQSHSITCFVDFETNELISKERILDMGQWKKKNQIEFTFFVNQIDKIKPICDKHKAKLVTIWFLINRTRSIEKAGYKQKPIHVRKDNAIDINYGTGNSNPNKIRYPKKCRKTAWKRFNKLFPNR